MHFVVTTKVDEEEATDDVQGDARTAERATGIVELCSSFDSLIIDWSTQKWILSAIPMH